MCVDLGGRRIIKKIFFQAEDGIRDLTVSLVGSEMCIRDRFLHFKICCDIMIFVGEKAN